MFCFEKLVSLLEHGVGLETHQVDESPWCAVAVQKSLKLSGRAGLRCVKRCGTLGVVAGAHTVLRVSLELGGGSWMNCFRAWAQLIAFSGRNLRKLR